MDNFILITGASTGIGEHAAGLYLQHGYHVLAGVRSEEDGQRLKSKSGPNLHPLLLDVTDEQQVRAAVELATRIIGTHQLVAIVNNAGIAIAGAVLHIPVAAWQKQFEVNVHGVIRVTQLFFPLLAKGSAEYHPLRIINISSVSGLFAAPFIGPYAASKYALEAISDSLRRELYMYDIQVVLIEPGNIKTPIWHKAKTEISYFGPEHDSILAYKDAIIDGNLKDSFELPALNRVLLKAVSSRNIKVRYLVRPQKWKFNLIRLLPVKLVDHLIRKKLQSNSGIRPF